MRLILDYDPLKGITESMDFSGGQFRIVQEQDVTPILERAKALASEQDYTKQGIKNDHWHYARIPDVILLEMKNKHGVSWEDKNDTKHRKFFRVLNEHYPQFKTTQWKHE